MSKATKPGPGGPGLALRAERTERMITVTLHDRSVRGPDAATVVRRMLKGRLFTSSMEEAAKRAEVWTGRRVRADRAESFLRDLEKAGVVLVEWKS